MNGSGYGNNYQLANLTNLFELCPDEVVTFVHGWGSNETLSKERLDRVKLFLNNSSSKLGKSYLQK